MSVIERAEKRLNDEIRQHELGLDNVDDIQYWAAYLDGARAQKKDAAAAIEELQAQLPKRGEWITIRLNNGGSYTGCSCCEAPIPTDTMLDYIPESESKYCYSCGAKMEVQE